MDFDNRQYINDSLDAWILLNMGHYLGNIFEDNICDQLGDLDSKHSFTTKMINCEKKNSKELTKIAKPRS
jgi:hypothetical protein